MLSIGLSDEEIPRYMRLWGLTLFGTLFFVGGLMRMVPIAAGLAYLIFIAPVFLLNMKIAQRRRLLRDQLVRGTQALANSARAGMSFIQGLEEAVNDVPQPLSGEFRRIFQEYQAGRPLPEALRDAQQRLNLESFTIFVSAILVCLERGGQITFALERLSEGLLEIQRLERKIEADTASGRKLAIILSAFPFVFMAGFSLMDPKMLGVLYTTLLGQVVVLVVGIIVFFAAKWCQRILNIDV
jgi:tight adherence protein B